MPEEIQSKLLEEEMRESYVDYAMSVIVGRALPDVRDGLKPVHRRILYSMHTMGLDNNKPFAKSARIVGDCFKYHPHGDVAVYDALVRMAQDFSLRYPLVQGHGNFGSIWGFEAAHMRYSEARLSKLAEEMLLDLNKDTVDFTPNFDGSLKEPTILPSKIPNLLINGSSGIAVGMATNIPPHNMAEIIDAIVLTIDNPDVSIVDIMKVVKGPDFPTGACILGTNGIKNAYSTGKGKITIRAKTEIKENKIIITEIPYQLNTSILIESMANLVRNKSVEGISDIRDESDKDGLRIVLDLKQHSNPELILNQLYKQTSLQTTFGIIMIALVNNEPKILNIKDLINQYILHRLNVVTRRTKFDLKKAEDRSHILLGLQIALKNIDQTIKLIKSSLNVESARLSLIKHLSITQQQADAILDMKLQRLTSLEQNKIKEEHDSLQKLIQELKIILSSEKNVLEVIKKELSELKEKYSDSRRTEILESEFELEAEDLIKEEDVVITITSQGYIKQINLNEYKQQRRGGKGIIATETKDTDFVTRIFTTSNHNYLLFFTNKGKVFWLKAYQIPSASRYSKGKAIINLLSLEKDEKISTILPISSFNNQHYLIMLTKKGLIKKTNLMMYSNPRKSGLIAINLRDNDELVQVRLTPGNLKMTIGSKNGLAVKFNEQDVRPMLRNATGVRAIRLKNDEVIGLEVAKEDASLLTITENGFGKRTLMQEYRLIRRGGKGVLNIKTTPRNGKVIGIKTVLDNDEIMIITKKGIAIRVLAKDIALIGRNTQGVRIIKLDSDDKVTSLTRVIANNNNNKK